MDVPDKSKDSEFLSADPPSRGVKRRLSCENLNIDIVQPKKCRDPKSANECIGGGDIPQGEEYSQCLNVVRSTGVKRRLAFDDANTHCSKKKTESSYVENDPSVEVTTSIPQGKTTNSSIVAEGGNDIGDNFEGVASVSVLSGNMAMGTDVQMQDVEQSGDKTLQVLHNNILQQPHDTG